VVDREGNPDDDGEFPEPLLKGEGDEEEAVEEEDFIADCRGGGGGLVDEE